MPTPVAARQLRQQRQQQAAGAGAEIEERGRRAARSGRRASTASTTVSLSGRGSSVSARQHEFEAPELAHAEDPAQRLVRDHPAPAVPRPASPSPSVIIRSGCAKTSAADKPSAAASSRRARRRGSSNPAAASAAATAPSVEPIVSGGVIPQGYSAAAASRSAVSAWVSASMISSSASPDITLSIL